MPFKPNKLGVAAGVLAVVSLLLLAIAGPAMAAPVTLHFEESEKGATFAFIDNAPKAKERHGFPTMISAGDMIVINNPLVEGGKRIGHISVACTATKSSKKFDAADFLCNGTFVLPGGTLIASAMIDGGSTEGAITGGTGKYAGARGTFVTKETKEGSNSPVTVTLLE